MQGTDMAGTGAVLAEGACGSFLDAKYGIAAPESAPARFDIVRATPLEDE